MSDGPAGSSSTNLQIAIDTTPYSASGGSNGAIFARLGSTYITTTSNLIDSNWHHIAVVRNSGTIKVYVDGTAEGSLSFTGNIGTDNSGSPRQRIGGFSQSNGIFSGYIDELRVTKGVARYTSDFTPQDREFYKGGSACDITSNNYDGILRGTSLVTSSEPKHYAFNNLGANIIYFDNNYTGLANTTAFTVGGWFYADDWNTTSSTDRVLFSKGAGNSGQNEAYGLYIHNSNTLTCRTKVTGTPANITVSYNLDNIADGWNHFMFTFDSYTTILYVNGTSVGSISWSGAPRALDFAGNNYPLLIGATPLGTNSLDTSTNNFIGKVALFKYYDDALTSTEILDSYNATKNRFI